MTAASIVAEIIEAIEALMTRGGLQAYLFGSALHTDLLWSDIDVLLVCDVDEDRQLARQTLLDLCMLYPIDLVIMTSREEAEFDFIRSENCQRIATTRA
jgi:predicted nucleotidyltransferase